MSRPKETPQPGATKVARIDGLEIALAAVRKKRERALRSMPPGAEKKGYLRAAEEITEAIQTQLDEIAAATHGKGHDARETEAVAGE